MATNTKTDHDQKKIKNSKDDRQQYQRLQLVRTQGPSTTSTP